MWQQAVLILSTYMPRQGQASQEAGPRHRYIKQGSAV